MYFPKQSLYFLFLKKLLRDDYNKLIQDNPDYIIYILTYMAGPVDL